MHNQSIGDFVAAREALLRWREGRRKALLIVELHFPPSHPLRKRVQQVCQCLGEYRYQADIAACRHADYFGDHVFNRKVGGVVLEGPVEWFYGDSLRVKDQRQVKIAAKIPQTKTLDLIERSAIYDLEGHGLNFIVAVNKLTTGARINSAAGRRLEQSRLEMDRCFQRMLTQLEKARFDNSQTYGALLCLSRRGMSPELCKDIIGFIA